jgi:hypothetical protein
MSIFRITREIANKSLGTSYTEYFGSYVGAKAGAFSDIDSTANSFKERYSDEGFEEVERDDVSIVLESLTDPDVRVIYSITEEGKR